MKAARVLGTCLAVLLASACQSAVSAPQTGSVNSSSVPSTRPSAGFAPFVCPTQAEVNALTAKAFVADRYNGAKSCTYRIAVGVVVQAVVAIAHPPVPDDAEPATLDEFRQQAKNSGLNTIVSAPQYSAGAFIVTVPGHSCTVWAVARDGQLMSVQASYVFGPVLDNCALAQSVTVLTGTSPVGLPATAEASTSGSVPVSLPTSSSAVSSSTAISTSAPATSESPPANCPDEAVLTAALRAENRPGGVFAIRCEGEWAVASYDAVIGSFTVSPDGSTGIFHRSTNGSWRLDDQTLLCGKLKSIPPQIYTWGCTTG